ncbi:ABC transporter ATP-binding protein [Candidatus Poriferisocius sp.]|uniref:ABC transporter ATP-binding protein n=1 Tax=Candidatus Poriferisocius sp. TaxID=3101276 RepID=UPI003B02484B
MNSEPGAGPATGTPLSVRGISRRFGSVQALANVDFTLESGEIHALVGENGAGKSTLAKIVAGSIRSDAGSMSLFGQPYQPSSRREGAAAGVAHVRQQLSLVRGLTVAQNLQLGRPGAPAVFNAAAARAEVERWSDEFALSVPAETLVDDMPLAVRQQAEILIAVAWGARLLILDEPSSALGPLETRALITLCHRLRAEGTPILYISHRLPELAELADRLTVLRAGRVVVEGADVRAADLREVATLMIGDVTLLEVNRPEIERGSTRLRVSDLSVSSTQEVGCHGLDFEVAGGEILGVVGIAGNGQESLAKALTGQVKLSSGHVLVDEVDISGSAREAIATGVAHLHEDRSTGLAAAFSVADNATARYAGSRKFTRFGVRLPDKIARHARELAERFQVRPPEPTAKASSLSGGNQQKLMAARELEKNPTVLVAHGPTKGLDPEAAKAMRDRCFAAAQAGGAVVVISADLDEVADLAHRVIVLYRGAVTDAFPIEDMTSERVGAAMAGLTESAGATSG